MRDTIKTVIIESKVHKAIKHIVADNNGTIQEEVNTMLKEKLGIEGE